MIRAWKDYDRVDTDMLAIMLIQRCHCRSSGKVIQNATEQIVTCCAKCTARCDA